MSAAAAAVTLARRARRSPRLAPLRRHAPLACTLAAAAAARSGHAGAARALGAVGVAGFVRTYAVSRREGRAATREHVARMARLRPEVLRNFYVTCIGSMEEEIKVYPRYDRRKHELRYRTVADVAARHTADGATVVDVGCASALVLDRLRELRRTRGIGFDLSPNGVRQRARRPDAPALAQAVVEEVPLRDGIADVVVFSEVIEHLIDAYAGLREVSRVMRTGGTMVLTTNNGSEMPCISPLRDPLTWAERMAGWRWPSVLAFRNITWHEPLDRVADPLPASAPTYAPHVHFSAAELVGLARDAGFELLSSGSFEFPAPQSPLAESLRRLGERAPRLGDLLADTVERAASLTPGVNRMGTHQILVFRKVAAARESPSAPWWVARLPLAPPSPPEREREEAAA